MRAAALALLWGVALMMAWAYLMALATEPEPTPAPPAPACIPVGGTSQGVWSS